MYVYTVKANYSNNSELTKQKIYINKDFEIVKAEVLNTDDIVMMKFDISSSNMNSNLSESDFKVSIDKTVETEESTSKIDDVIYPMYIPANTALSSKETVKTEDGERIILTFSGDSPFVLIEETVNISDENVIIPVDGSLEIVAEVFGSASDNSVNWISDGIEYYVASESLDKSELLQIASSVSVLPVIK